MLAAAALLGAAAGNAVSGGGGAGPTGPPTNPSTYNAGDEGSPTTGVQWTNGDVTASTGIGVSSSQSVDPTSNFGSVSPGITSFETGISSSNFWYVRHQKNGQSSVWVLAGQGF